MLADFDRLWEEEPDCSGARRCCCLADAGATLQRSTVSSRLRVARPGIERTQR